ncbi:hypothetical protein QCA50_007165 [Cerrena zonata]|uniref:C2H2-type domain-containing protein n=1 Tax=Cerrena zonata TaxID=2478898 RepID=A0AAW0GGV8_9APHY
MTSYASVSITEALQEPLANGSPEWRESRICRRCRPFRRFYDIDTYWRHRLQKHAGEIMQEVYGATAYSAPGPGLSASGSSPRSTPSPISGPVSIEEEMDVEMQMD